MKFADLHQHILWGLDDGPAEPAQMQALLQQAAEQGVGLIAATCHASPSEAAFDWHRYRLRLDEANAYCTETKLALRLVSGCEIFYADNAADQLCDGRLPCLGRSRNVLVEFSTSATPERLAGAAQRLYQAGFRPVLAHIERYDCLLHSRHARRQVRWLKEECGFVIQVNAQTVLQPRGWREGRFVRMLLKERLIDVIASDAHSVHHRPVLIGQAFDKLSSIADPGYVDYLRSQPWALLGEPE